ncbi:hypothetical protein RvY_00017 [Ramazzottius varieornatus]|uniref:MYND-type domain-containing protein n=1 Tax=Ramazzottius varieornatus TaxID=947166 RepID=A0A1D1UEZ2_RAMVA|nr:hypothetical protein RvY_00017 [Ramazzottius varieornatus]
MSCDNDAEADPTSTIAISEEEKPSPPSAPPLRPLDPLVNFPTFKFTPKEAQPVLTDHNQRTITSGQPVEKAKAFQPAIEFLASAKDVVVPRTRLPQATKHIPIEHHKKHHYGCEICGRPPSIMCSACKETYYCGEEHCLLDFHAIHKFICVKLKIVRNVASKSEQWKRHSKQDIAENIKMRKIILLNIANNMAGRHLIRGNYSFTICCSLLAQKMVQELYGGNSPQIVRPYLSMAEAYLLRQKLERSRYYSALIHFLTSHKLGQQLPTEQEQQLRRLEANQLARQGKWQQAKLVLATQIVEIAFETGLDNHCLLDSLFHLANVCFLDKDIVAATAFYAYFLQILSDALVKDVTQGAASLHRVIEEDLNEEVIEENKLGITLKDDLQWAHLMSQTDYAVYLKRERILMYLRTIMLQFETANRTDFPDIFPALHYCVAMALFICRQWKEASNMYGEAVSLTTPARQADFSDIHKVMDTLQAHAKVGLNALEVVEAPLEVRHKKGKKKREPIALKPAEVKPCINPVKPLWRPQLVDFEAEEKLDQDDELGLTMKRLVDNVNQYKKEQQQKEAAANADNINILSKLGII